MDVRRKWFAMRAIRKQRRLSSATVAMAVGISGDRYIRIEKNEVKNITTTEKALLCSFFQMSEQELFAIECEPTGYCSRCRTRTMPLNELEAMLVVEYGNKLKPNKKCLTGTAIPNEAEKKIACC